MSALFFWHLHVVDGIPVKLLHSYAYLRNLGIIMSSECNKNGSNHGLDIWGAYLRQCTQAGKDIVGLSGCNIFCCWIRKIINRLQPVLHWYHLFLIPFGYLWWGFHAFGYVWVFNNIFAFNTIQGNIPCKNFHTQVKSPYSQYGLTCIDPNNNSGTQRFSPWHTHQISMFDWYYNSDLHG